VAKCHDARKVFHYFQLIDEFSYLPQFFEKCEAKNLTIPLDGVKRTTGVKWAVFYLKKNYEKFYFLRLAKLSMLINVF
jgi:hypothetical protein